MFCFQKSWLYCFVLASWLCTRFIIFHFYVKLASRTSSIQDPVQVCFPEAFDTAYWLAIACVYLVRDFTVESDEIQCPWTWKAKYRWSFAISNKEFCVNPLTVLVCLHRIYNYGAIVCNFRAVLRCKRYATLCCSTGLRTTALIEILLEHFAEDPQRKTISLSASVNFGF